MILLGNRPEGFTQEYIDSIKAFFHVCETLVIAQILYQKDLSTDDVVKKKKLPKDFN